MIVMMENLEEIKKANIKVEVVTTSTLCEAEIEVEIHKRMENADAKGYRYDEFWCNEVSLFLQQLECHI